MAKAVSEEEVQLRKRARRRLVGAITLVTVAVVILPMVLDSKPEQRRQEIDIRIPSEDLADEFTPGVAPQMDAPAVPEESATGLQQEQQKKSRSSVESVPSVPEPVQKPVVVGKSPDPKVGESGGSKVAGATTAFVVQLGAFSDPVKATQQQQGLVQKGIKAYTETLKIDKGKVTRVRVGPFPTREEAEDARVKLKKLGLEGVVADK